jgi:hypothetical protein
MDKEVRIAKIKAREAERLATLSFLKEMMKNPIFELVAGLALITYLNRGTQSWQEAMTGIDLKATVEGAGLVTIIGLQQLAPLAPYIAQGAEGLGKALPGLLALAAA